MAALAESWMLSLIQTGLLLVNCGVAGFDLTVTSISPAKLLQPLTTTINRYFPAALRSTLFN